MDIKPTNEVSEYTATIAYKLLNEGEDGRQMVDSVKFALRAEGTSILMWHQLEFVCVPKPSFLIVQDCLHP